MGLSGKLLQLIALPGVIIIFAIVAAAGATTATIPKPDCPSKCGVVEIPFPFGLTEGCYLDESFHLTCNDSGTPMRGNIPVRNISIETHELHVLNYVAKDCPMNGSNNRPWVRVSQYTISNSKNKFTVIGCDTNAYLSGYQNGEEYKIGCSSQCPTPKNVGNGFCSGVGCCEVRFPNRLKNFSIEVQSFNNHTNISNFNPCGYAFVVEKGEFNFSASYLKNYTNQTVPLVLDWAIMSNPTCEEAQNKPNFACKDSNSECIDNQARPDGYRCQCKQGYRGNPYLLQGHGGCDIDIDECSNQTLNNCTNYCFNTPGSYNCSCPKLHSGDGKKEGSGCSVNLPLVTMVPIGIGIGLTAMVGRSWWLYLEFQARISIRLKAKFFLQNGGSNLKEHLQGSAVNKAKIFTSEELKEATKNYEGSRIIGEGGFGPVYKGVLPNNTFIAIKKSKTVDKGQVDQFIEEIIQLSKIDHENVVKLLGCCLEMKDPLLVYEFVPKGTLFDYIRNESNTSTKQWEWETRLRIAAEIADALLYLHSLAIIHRNVKPSNILLGDNFTAKVFDFEISKFPKNQKDVALVQKGTHEYLDPEYFQTNQLTEKSDVYSFGVVLVELLIGIDVAPSTRSKKRINVVKYFLRLLKENDQLSELLDCDIVEEENKEQIKEVVKLAERCLRLKGDERPTMEELRNKLASIGGIRKTKTHSSVNVELNMEKQEHDLPGDPEPYAYDDGGISICNNISLGCWPMNVGM